MRAVILAAGRGSRMGDATDDRPKAFLEVDGRTLYDRQREALAGRVDGITVVVGYKRENVVDHLSSADVVVLDRWDEYENAESLRLALERVDDDVLVLNGDVVVTPSTVDRLIERYRSFDGAYNVVGCLPGVQNRHTAVRCDEAGNVVDYGRIPGQRHAGVGVVGARHRERSMELLGRNREEWYPIVYSETPTKRLRVPPTDHLEINRHEDLEAARDRLPLWRSAEGDLAR